MLKRMFDLVLATLGLIALTPAMLAAALAVRLDSPGPALYRQKRVGRGFQPFEILKFRSMVQGADQIGRQITAGADPRVTRVGHWLRKTKIDELPQLINVIKGEMSLVGPRPELPKYVEMFRDDFTEILSIRPGITDLASIRFRDEASILGKAQDPEHEYVTRVLPDKIALAKKYIGQSSLVLDGFLIAKTLFRLADPRRKPSCP
jgi:lipopolysaccharide/colanic/teichoic acid biosynthesis glycosyltransferase